MFMVSFIPTPVLACDLYYVMIW
jgi:hypothetical protein